MNAFRQLLSGQLRRIPTDAITNEFAFSFSASGWNYVRALVAQCDREPALALEDSIFYRFFCHERVRSVRYLNDVLFLHDPQRMECEGDFKFWLGTYPWGDHVAGGPWGHHFDAVEGVDTENLYGPVRNPWYRPGDPRPLEQEWTATIEVYCSIAKNGYRPLPHGFPEATLLVRSTGEIRAVRYNGQHRLAALSHLGYRTLSVVVPSARVINRELESWPSSSALPKVVNRHEIVVREEEVDSWPYVRRSLCTRKQALAIFDAFFELNGRERIEHLGLPSVY